MCETNRNVENRFEIIPISPELFPQVIRMSDKYLGEGMYTKESLRRIIGDDCSRFCLVKERDSGDAAAIFYFHWGKFDSICGQYPYIDKSLCESGETTGVLRSIAVKEQYRKTGLSEYLITLFSEQLFTEFNVSRVFALAWVKQNYVPANHCLNNCGFTALYRVERPWYSEKDLKCNICGGGRCICDGLLFSKTKNNN